MSIKNDFISELENFTDADNYADLIFKRAFAPDECKATERLHLPCKNGSSAMMFERDLFWYVNFSSYGRRRIN